MQDFAEDYRDSDPAVNNITATGSSRVNSGMMFIAANHAASGQNIVVIDRLPAAGERTGSESVLMAVSSRWRTSITPVAVRLLSTTCCANKAKSQSGDIADWPMLTPIRKIMARGMNLIYDRDTVARLGDVQSRQPVK